MRSSLCFLPERPVVEDPQTGDERPATDGELLNRMNCVVVGSDDGGEYILVAQGNAPPKEVADVLIDGREGYWEWSDLRREYPDAADRILEASVVREDEQGNAITQKLKVADAVDPVEVDLPPPGVFAGDEEGLVANREVRDDEPPYRREDFEDYDAPVVLLAEHRVEEWNEWRTRNLKKRPDLRGFDFATAKLAGADLRDVDLRGGLLDRANLQGIRLDGADLRGAQLIGADLTGGRILRADLGDCNAREAVFDECRIALTDFESTKLNGASFYDVDGSRLDRKIAPSFRGSSLNGADFRNAELPHADFQDAELFRADLTNAQLSGSDFSGSVMVKAVLKGSELRNADFSGADLSRSTVCGADLRRANLSDADVSQISYEEYGGDTRFRGIRVATCYGDAIFRRDAEDADFLESFRAQKPRWVHELWRVTCDFGRSWFRFAVWLIGFIGAWAGVYGVLLGPEHFAIAGDQLPWNWLTPIYYSVVTFSTLGLGDITPITTPAMGLVIAEVTLGYVMFGILITLVATKIARRA